MGQEEQGKDRTELEREHSRRPEANPGNISEDPDPLHTLNNPVKEPDPTEYPDPYDKREDPRDPKHVGTPADPEDDDPVDPAPRAPSTSEPHPPRNYDDVKPVKGDQD